MTKISSFFAKICLIQPEKVANALNNLKNFI